MFSGYLVEPLKGSELRASGCTGERYNVAYVGHSRDELDSPFQAKSEPGVRDRSVAA